MSYRRARVVSMVVPRLGGIRAVVDERIKSKGNAARAGEHLSSKLLAYFWGSRRGGDYVTERKEGGGCGRLIMCVVLGRSHDLPKVLTYAVPDA